MFENILPDDVSFTDLLKSPQSIFLVKDQQIKSGLASPFHYQNLWKTKEDFTVDNKANDEFMEMYQFSNTEDHRLTNMFTAKGERQNDGKLTPQSGFQKIPGLEPPSGYSDGKEGAVPPQQ